MVRIAISKRYRSRLKPVISKNFRIQVLEFNRQYRHCLCRKKQFLTLFTRFLYNVNIPIMVCSKFLLITFESSHASTVSCISGRILTGGERFMVSFRYQRTNYGSIVPTQTFSGVDQSSTLIASGLSGRLVIAFVIVL